MKNVSFLLLLLVLFFCLSGQGVGDGSKPTPITPILGLLLSGDTSVQEKIPSLSLVVSQGLDTLHLAWIPGNDGVTPENLVQYDIYLSTTETFTPEPSSLKKTVVGISQTEITGLQSDTLYYAQIIATYRNYISEPSNILQAKTYKDSILVDSSVEIVIASDLGLGSHTTSDGIFYTYSGGSPPSGGSILFSEDVLGGMTIRTVVTSSVNPADGSVFVLTSEASLNDVIDRGSIYSSFQLFDVAQEAKGLSSTSTSSATARSAIQNGDDVYSRIDWKKGFLSAQQITYSHQEEDFLVFPEGDTSTIRLFQPNAVEESFKASVTAEFEPKLTTEAIWGGIIFKELLYAEIEAKGTLSLTAIAEYNFAASGDISKEFPLFERTWYALYAAGPVPVYQEITLSMGVKVSAEAKAEIKALAKAELVESVKIGARYHHELGWSPYIVNKESTTLTASLDIVGKVSAEIRLIPKIDVKFYKVSNASLTIEPFVNSSLTVEETTNNLYFLAAHPDRLVQPTAFDTTLGIEANFAVSLSALGRSWDVLGSTCVLGTNADTCATAFNALALFSIPKFALTAGSSTPPTPSVLGETELQFKVTNGANNTFANDSIEWEFYPADPLADIEPGACTLNPDGSKNCMAIFTKTFGAQAEHTIFSSGYGSLGEIARQYKEIALPDNGNTCTADPQTVSLAGNDWMRCDTTQMYATAADATSYCQGLVLAGHSDWRLPTKDELKSIVYCSNGAPVPLADFKTCGDDPEHPGPYDEPTWNPALGWQGFAGRFWTSTPSGSKYWFVFFHIGYSEPDSEQNAFVRCVR